MKHKWKGLLLTPSKASMAELYKYGLTISDVKDVLTNGRPCEKSKRKADTHEICLDRKNKTTRVVVAKTYSMFEQADIWLIVHVGIHSRR